MAVIEIAKIQVRRGQENQTGIPALAGGEFAWAADTEHLYIGLRREDGGSRDENVRILTENDLFSAVGNTATTYTYREGSYLTSVTGDDLSEEVVRTVSEVLDEAYVSVNHFKETGEDGDVTLRRAITRLFANDQIPALTGAERRLIIPAGTYNIADTVFLPSNTILVGEGPDKTILNVLTTSKAFVTVASGGATFDDIDAFSGLPVGEVHPSNIHIEGMTIQYSTATLTQFSDILLSIDMAEDVTVKNVKFKGHRVSPDTSTNHYYSGVDIRGWGEITSRNILIENCEFDGLRYAVMSAHDIEKLNVENSYLHNLLKGVNFNFLESTGKHPDATTGPRYCKILNNRFDVIDEQGIYVGNWSTSTSQTGTFHLSMNNIFEDVGSYSTLYYNTLTNTGEGGTGTAIISFNDTLNNSTVNDLFSRFEFQQRSISTSTSYTHSPLVEGRTVLDAPYVSIATLAYDQTESSILRLPITGFTQNISLRYSIFKTENGFVTTYLSTATYIPADEVFYNGNKYIVNTATNETSSTEIISIVGIPPSDSVYWTFNSAGAIDRLGQVEIYLPPGNSRADVTSSLLVYDNYNYSGDDTFNNSIGWTVQAVDGYRYYDVVVTKDASTNTSDSVVMEFTAKVIT
jgi:hypothetical protein